jgi:hypothetical protein
MTYNILKVFSFCQNGCYCLDYQVFDKSLIQYSHSTNTSDSFYKYLIISQLCYFKYFFYN